MIRLFYCRFGTRSGIGLGPIGCCVQSGIELGFFL